jgi:hypothetical protein
VNRNGGCGEPSGRSFSKQGWGENVINLVRLSFKNIPLQLAKLVADEFFDQGDMEKLQLNITPIVSQFLVLGFESCILYSKLST